MPNSHLLPSLASLPFPPFLPSPNPPSPPSPPVLVARRPLRVGQDLSRAGLPDERQWQTIDANGNTRYFAWTTKAPSAPRPRRQCDSAGGESRVQAVDRLACDLGHWCEEVHQVVEAQSMSISQGASPASRLLHVDSHLLVTPSLPNSNSLRRSHGCDGSQRLPAGERERKPGAGAGATAAVVAVAVVAAAAAAVAAAVAAAAPLALDWRPYSLLPRSRCIGTPRKSSPGPWRARRIKSRIPMHPLRPSIRVFPG